MVMASTQEVAYPKLEALGFGAVSLDGEKWERDFFIRASGQVKVRKKRAVKELYGTSHVVGVEELEKVCKGDPAVLIVASGYAGAVRLAPEAGGYLEGRGIKVEVQPTPEAVKLWAKEKGPKAILVHVTC